MTTVHHIRPLRFRSIWISDVHLGTKGCRAEFLLDFLNSTDCQYLFLVGDIIDVWQMKKGIYWPQSHSEIICKIMKKARHGTKVIYVPGNHDELARDYNGMQFGNISVHRKYLHETADGRRLLVLHGDEFDGVVQCSKFLALLGSKAYDWLLSANVVVNHVRRYFGFPYWSLAAYLKHKVKNAVNFIGDFERAVAFEAKKQHVDGLVCGHIHRAEITHIDDVLYCNDGDWVESCTALTERYDGSLDLMHWADQKHTLKTVSSQESTIEDAA